MNHTGILAGACEAGTGQASPALAALEVPPLADDEVSQVRGAFPELGRLAADERSAWLLRRVGIIDALLRGDAVASLPDGSLSEADVLGAVWHSWVRNREKPLPGGATPDGRAEAMTGLARRHLTGSGAGGPVTADPRALASLRSDGLLLPAGPRFAFGQGDDFSGDMVRDFALAVLFTREGFGVLQEAGAPRWALRAARMACQGTLIGPDRGSPGLAGRMRDLHRQFDVMAAASGDRWADLPWEAALTAGTAGDVLRECAPDLLQPGGLLLDRMLRLVTQRFSEAGAADPVIAAPVVAFLTEHAAETAAVRYQFAEEAGKLTAAWLRAVRRAEMAGGTAGRWRPLRAQVRDSLLRSGETRLEVEVECLALLGSDTDTRVTGRLRNLASSRPHRLAPCVELFDPAMSLAATDLDLLFELTEAYYIEEPAVSARTGWHSMGIRRHEHTHGAFGVPLADWRFGPFCLLLPAAPARALALINRMADHAANQRVSPDAEDWHGPGPPAGEASGAGVLPGVQLDIPGTGGRYFTGDAQVWAWYRGTGVGPYPCMSALMAVEHVADQWLQRGTSLAGLVTALLRDAHSLAMPGLVVGILTRHAEQVTSEADPFLASPGAWGLESARAVMEAGIHAQGRDDPSLPGSDRRNWTMADLAGCLVFHAVQRGDQDRIEALRTVGRTLAAASAEAAGRMAGREDGPADSRPGPAAADPGEDRQLTPVARRWASMLDADNYTVREDNGNLIWEWQPPPGIVAALAPGRADVERWNQVYRLLDTYSLRPDPPFLDAPPPLPPAQALIADAGTARSLAQQPPGPGPEPSEAAAAVAAALVRAAAERASPVPGDDLEWAAVTIAAALSSQPEPSDASGDSALPHAAGRSAASAVACLLMPALTEPGDQPALFDDEDLGVLAEILAGAAAAPFTEVRMTLARALAAVWSAPCGPGPHGGSRCRHVIAWAAVEAGARHVALGPLEFPAGRRGRRHLDGPLPAALAACPATDLMLTLLAPPLVAACDAARSGSCITAAARDLRDSLLGAYTRAAVLWGEEGYDQDDEGQCAVAGALLAADAQEPGLAARFAAGLAGQATALHENLRAMTVTATYLPAARASLRAAWPAVMTAVLDAAGAGASGFADRHGGGHAVAEMFPSPSPTVWDSDPDATVSAARDGWPGPLELNSQIERMLPFAAGHWHAADKLIGLLQTVPLAEQARAGLPWVHQILAGRGRIPGLGTWRTVGWLRSLEEGNAVTGPLRPLYDAVLDALAAEDYAGAVELQKHGEIRPSRPATG